MRNAISLFVLLFCAPVFLSAQISLKNMKAPETVVVEGKIYDQVSGAPLNQAKVTVFDDMMIASLAQTETDADGSYTVQVPKVARYKVQAEKPTYFDQELALSHIEGVSS